MDPICAKCKTEPSVIEARGAFFCKSCLIQSVSHRFAYAIAKTNLPNESRALMAITTGSSSRCLLDVSDRYFHVDARKKTRFSEMMACHITMDEESVSELDQWCRQHGFLLVVRPLYSVFESQEYPNATEQKERLSQLLMGCKTETVRQDLIQHLRDILLVKIAKELNFSVICYADNAARVAINALGSTIKGRGYALPLDIAPLTHWNRDVAIIRPMKDILLNEIEAYCEFMNLDYIQDPLDMSEDTDHFKSLNDLTANFVLRLQKDYPHTVSSIIRTAFKVDTKMNSELDKHCRLCHGPVAEEALLWRETHTVTLLTSPISQPTDQNICYSCYMIEKEIQQAIVIP